MRAVVFAKERTVPGIQAGEMLSLGMRGKLGAAAGLGFAVCGRSRSGDSAANAGIYQSRVTGYNRYGRSPGRKRKRYYVLMRNYAPTNPRTVPQQSNRTKFADAVAVWMSLTTEQKSVYNERGAKQARHGKNLFISEYMRSN